MKLIAGLGNPGSRYDGTRHNIGFRVVDELARRWDVSVSRFDKRAEALTGEASPEGRRTLLLKPQTYMNLSGRSVRAVLQFYKLAPEDLLIVLDDLDLPVGRIRIRASGSGGGHKGLENVLLLLGCNEIARLRIGIGQARGSSATHYVTGQFAPDEHEAIDQAVVISADAVECWLERGVDTAMNRYNVKD